MHIWAMHIGNANGTTILLTAGRVCKGNELLKEEQRDIGAFPEHFGAIAFQHVGFLVQLQLIAALRRMSC